VDSLEKFPELGRIVPERNQPAIREIMVKNYHIIYRVRENEKIVEIPRVSHGARGEPEV
jgi:plasmid stabilization system protein ParE